MKLFIAGAGAVFALVVIIGAWSNITLFANAVMLIAIGSLMVGLVVVARHYWTMTDVAKVQSQFAPPQLPNLTTLHFSPKMESGKLLPSIDSVVPQLTTSNEPLKLEMPVAPSLIDLINRGWLPTIHQMLLGYTNQGPLYGSIEDLLSTAIAGRPKMGKTTLLRFIAAQLMLVGGRLVVLDPHGSLADGAIIPAEWIASSKNEMNDGAAWLIDELESRLAEFRKGKREFAPLMVMADEWPVISLSSKDAVAAAQRVILEARKTNYYGLISGQGLPASNFGGSLARDALSSRYIFKTTAAQGRIAGLDKDTARLVEGLERGQAIFEGPINPIIVAIPNITGSDLTQLLTPRAERAYEAPKASYPSADVGMNFSSHSEVYNMPTSQQPPVDAKFRELPTNAPEYYESLPNPGELARAYQAWVSGANAVRRLEVALSCSNRKARQLIEQLKAEGLI